MNIFKTWTASYSRQICVFYSTKAMFKVKSLDTGLDWYQNSKYKNSKMCAHTYTSIQTAVIMVNDCLICCISVNVEVIKYHVFLFVVVIEHSVRHVRCLSKIQGLKTG